jgi:uncharacterized membrane protein
MEDSSTLLTSTTPPEPTQDERTMATLAHALQPVGWWIAPLIILVLKRESKFVSFHALQALLLQICVVVVWVGFTVLWVSMIFSTVFTQGTAPSQNAPPPTAFFVVMPLMWLFFMGLWALVLSLSIIYAIKGGRGEWAQYPLLGRLSRRILKI